MSVIKSKMNKVCCVGVIVCSAEGHRKECKIFDVEDICKRTVRNIWVKRKNTQMLLRPVRLTSSPTNWMYIV